MYTIDTYLQTHPTFIHATVGYALHDDEILLGVRKRVSFGLGEQLIAGIGGKLEPGETDEQALKREFLEEIETEVVNCTLAGNVTYLFPHKPKWNQEVSIYRVEKWRGEPQETEDIQPQWFKQTELPKDRMWPDNLYTIPKVLAGQPIDGVFLYGEDGTIAEYRLS